MHWAGAARLSPSPCQVAPAQRSTSSCPSTVLRPVSQESRIGLSLHHTLTNTPSNSSQSSPHQLSLVDWSYSAQQGPRLTMLGINPMIVKRSHLSAAERAKQEQLEENLQTILIVGLGLATASGVIASSD
ncbi:hypothetical protein Rifp1Sym_dl00060 [endosymbiont of Riftia pachyptila (vent Ph05)]|uniref:Uncharacterized protein n=1 Tax=endosymbiont of Riftia pachyptila (vent Ph05) TaxID=1048808 RepID=G2DGE3_9GAMM|nr:hypothetical protein Rifp1Sym_dl00060 [endosymbiont of Riftia pachyptila (vent Ph05)]